MLGDGTDHFNAYPQRVVGIPSSDVRLVRAGGTQSLAVAGVRCVGVCVSVYMRVPMCVWTYPHFVPGPASSDMRPSESGSH